MRSRSRPLLVNNFKTDARRDGFHHYDLLGVVKCGLVCVWCCSAMVWDGSLVVVAVMRWRSQPVV